jgi:predicted metal-dependent hydrolase
MKQFIFGTFVYDYKLIRQDRKTLSLTVTPTLELILKCPTQAEPARIEAFLQKKWFWLEKQLSFFKKYQRKVYKKEYVSGEGYLYLGRQYKLVVKRGDRDSVSLTRGQLIVQTAKDIDNYKHTKKLIDKWFFKKATTILQAQFNKMLSHFDYEQTPVLGIREMKKRWGSFLNKEKIILNPKLIHTPKECINYVIVHELCHLEYKSHNSDFWKLLDVKYPKWKKVKDKLETIGASLF